MITEVIALATYLSKELKYVKLSELTTTDIT